MSKEKGPVVLALVKNTKICGGCGDEKPTTVEFFARHPNGKLGLRSNCKVCTNKVRRERRGRNPEESRRVTREEQEALRRRRGMKDMAAYRQERETATTKVCAACAVEKPKSEFGVNPTLATIDHLESYCNACKKIVKSRGRDAQYWASRLVGHARGRHAKMGFNPDVFDLTIEYLEGMFDAQHGRCAWFGLPMTTARKSGPMQASLDRLDNSYGYQRGNVALVTKTANLARNDASMEEFEVFIAQLKISLGNRRN